MIKLFHGTTLIAAKNILESGFSPALETTWNCSDPTVTYFYQEQKKAENIISTDETCLQYALEAGQIQNALLFVSLPLTVVLEIHIKNIKSDIIYPDMSAPSMADMEAVCIKDKEINNILKNHECYIIIHYYTFPTKSSNLFLVGHIKNPYARDMLEDRLSIDEINILEQLYNDDVFIDGLFEQIEISATDAQTLLDNINMGTFIKKLEALKKYNNDIFKEVIEK